MATQIAEERDYFTDRSVLLDPYEWFENMRANGPVHKLPGRDIVIVTGFQEAVEVLLNAEDFSSVITAEGPVNDLPFPLDGGDITRQIEEFRLQMSPTDLVVTYDGPRHSATRALLMGLFTPSRLKANGVFMAALADEMISKVVAKGECEIIKEIAAPYVTLVIADLLGVPEEDRDKFREVIDAGPPAGNIDPDDPRPNSSTLDYLAIFFAEYVADRRANPQPDVLTELATATLPNGVRPEAEEIVKLAMFLFAAGQDTSAKLLGNSIRRLAENPAMQNQLREDRSLVAPFVEEVLRMEGSTKCTFRLAKRKTHIGDSEIVAGTRILISFAAANRDPRRWENPEEFRIGRPKIKEHVAFGRGAHVCAGAPLARVEVIALLNCLFDKTSEITLSEEHHGPVGQRRLSYEPSFIIRGLERLHVKLKAA
ncbi:MAG TPA: cytochrome P450 [Sphingobium sp.]|uniref:cytochrome P450 n=1 Tax=Sphingobium sp. TaxID=1912891 RepID=UPI002ED56C24